MKVIYWEAQGQAMGKQEQNARNTRNYFQEQSTCAVTTAVFNSCLDFFFISLRNVSVLHDPSKAGPKFHSALRRGT